METSGIPQLDKLIESKDVEGLIDALRRRSYPETLVIEALAEIGDTRAVEPLIEVRKAEMGERSRITHELHVAMRELKDPRAVDILLEALDDYNHGGAAEALGEIGDSRAVEPLIKALKNEREYTLRREAATALGKIGDIKAVQPLIEALKDDDFLVRECAVDALGEIGDPRAVEPIIQALKGGEDYAFRMAAIRAFAGIGDKKGIDQIVSFLNDENNWVREAANFALNRLKTKEA